MKILVIGASRGTGALATQVAAERGHSVTAFARDPRRLAFEHERVSLVTGDFHRADSVDAAVRGQDAVIITASATSLKGFKQNPHYFSLGTGYAIDAMKAHGVKRLIVLSALGTGDSRHLLSFAVRALLVSFLLKGAFEDHERQEKQVMASGLDWVIARPGRLTDGPAHGRYITDTQIAPVPSSISRADLAHFLVDAATTDTWLGHAVQLGG